MRFLKELVVWEITRRLIHILRPRRRIEKRALKKVHEEFIQPSMMDTVAVDLGCGSSPKNLFGASKSWGVDMFAEGNEQIKAAHLGFDLIPFESASVDYLTAYDVLEHIPKFSDRCPPTFAPFIFLMNESYRVLKPGGIFLSLTPVYPYSAAFQDPTHNNIITVNTFKYYFSDEKYKIAEHYGIVTNYKILYEKIHGEHLLAVLQKQ